MRISDWSSDVCSSDLISKSGRTARALGPGNKCRDDSLEDDRQLATRCFPELSLYGWSGPEARPGDEVMVGDAIDDLADLYAELRGVVWLSTNSRSENATWQFRHGFQSHLGAPPSRLAQPSSREPSLAAFPPLPDRQNHGM